MLFLLSIHTHTYSPCCINVIVTCCGSCLKSVLLMMIMFFCLFHFSLVLRYNFPSFFLLGPCLLLGITYVRVLVVLKDKTYAFIMYSHCVCLPQIGDMKRLISLQPLKNCSVLFQFWKLDVYACVDGLKLGGCFLL